MYVSLESFTNILYYRFLPINLYYKLKYTVYTQMNDFKMIKLAI